MRLTAPDKAPEMGLTDVTGRHVEVGVASGRRTLLCFFRDPACPFCNYRVYELTFRFDEFARLGLDVIAVFAADDESVKRFVAKKPRPFPVIADPQSVLYAAYGVQHFSRWGKVKALFTRLPTLIKGLRLVGLAGLRTTNRMPADFLIDERGRIAETWYGRDAGDRIPLERVELFAARGLVRRTPAASAA